MNVITGQHCMPRNSTETRTMRTWANSTAWFEIPMPVKNCDAYLQQTVHCSNTLWQT